MMVVFEKKEQVTKMELMKMVLSEEQVEVGEV